MNNDILVSSMGLPFRWQLDDILDGTCARKTNNNIIMPRLLHYLSCWELLDRANMYNRMQAYTLYCTVPMYIGGHSFRYPWWTVSDSAWYRNLTDRRRRSPTLHMSDIEMHLMQHMNVHARIRVRVRVHVNNIFMQHWHGHGHGWPETGTWTWTYLREKFFDIRYRTAPIGFVRYRNRLKYPCRQCQC
jgi:hypothetical protein